MYIYIYIMKSSGPKIDSCGVHSILSLTVLSFHYCHDFKINALPSTKIGFAYLFHNAEAFLIILWSTVSKAFNKSMKNTCEIQIIIKWITYLIN